MVHKKCSGIKGSMSKVMKSFICRCCMNPVNGTGRTTVDIGVNANLELQQNPIIMYFQGMLDLVRYKQSMLQTGMAYDVITQQGGV